MQLTLEHASLNLHGPTYTQLFFNWPQFYVRCIIMYVYYYHDNKKITTHVVRLLSHTCSRVWMIWERDLPIPSAGLSSKCALNEKDGKNIRFVCQGLHTPSSALKEKYRVLSWRTER